MEITISTAKTVNTHNIIKGVALGASLTALFSIGEAHAKAPAHPLLQADLAELVVTDAELDKAFGERTEIRADLVVAHAKTKVERETTFLVPGSKKVRIEQRVRKTRFCVVGPLPSGTTETEKVRLLNKCQDDSWIETLSTTEIGIGQIGQGNGNINAGHAAQETLVAIAAQQAGKNPVAAVQSFRAGQVLAKLQPAPKASTLTQRLTIKRAAYRASLKATRLARREAKQATVIATSPTRLQ